MKQWSTAEEFRENSQRSIALFNTEKLSTNSTHVLKSAYCNSVHFCRCNLHGACGGKDQLSSSVSKNVIVAICTERVETKLPVCVLHCARNSCNLHGACGGKGQSHMSRSRQACCNLHGACGGKDHREKLPTCSSVLQSARDVWKVLQYPSTKNPRKFMQAYCIFIHLGV